MNLEASDTVSYENAVFFAYAYEMSVALPAGAESQTAAASAAPQNPGLLRHVGYQPIADGESTHGVASAGAGLRTVLGIDSLESALAQRWIGDGLVTLSLCALLISLAVFASRALTFRRA